MKEGGESDDPPPSPGVPKTGRSFKSNFKSNYSEKSKRQLVIPMKEDEDDSEEEKKKLQEEKIKDVTINFGYLETIMLTSSD